MTNLLDAGAGSFRDAASSGSRRIVFDVGGTIPLGNYVYLQNATTVDGSTAPSPGITFAGHPLMIYDGVHDIIINDIRHRADWRVTPGVRNGDGTCITIWKNCYNVVVARCSLSGFDDEALNIWESCHDVTVQDCILGPGVWPLHKFTLLVGLLSSRVSVLRNLFTGAPEQRNPAIQYDDSGAHGVAPSITGDVINNLVWDYRVYGTGVYYGAKANVIGNYYYTSTLGGQFNKAAKIFNDTDAVGTAYLAMNYSKDGSTFATTVSDPAAQASIYAVDAYAQVTPMVPSLAAVHVLANAGCRIGGLDATDSALIAAVVP